MATANQNSEEQKATQEDNYDFDSYFPTLAAEMHSFDTTVNLHDLQCHNNSEEAGNTFYREEMVNMLNRVN